MEKSSSKIVLIKNEDFLEIIIPPAGLRSYMSLTIFGVMFMISSIPLAFLVLGIYWVDLPNKIFLALFSIPWWGFSIAMLWVICGILFQNTRIKIDQQQISLTHEISGFIMTQATPSQKNNINKLERTKRHIKSSSPNDGGIIIEPEIIIWAGENKYSISSSPIVSEADLDWLADELSDWLKIPIDRD
ncbi:serine/threonine kinase [Nostoc commune NIES-4072]|uniref:Serine/threonine kinase n=1 Tax=Nostoc commune NIES-4072 TaxID=2005467 RepID=A0A2R5FY50_NOSCO|nr:hypothetical protein [Nostoc commune]BBD70884.1 serine/threonine kinase [Nostoc commune HK-02]GBG23650.1 serine/threonine kinase [Nostoc commune NIES-4072]